MLHIPECKFNKQHSSEQMGDRQSWVGDQTEEVLKSTAETLRIHFLT